MLRQRPAVTNFVQQQDIPEFSISAKVSSGQGRLWPYWAILQLQTQHLATPSLLTDPVTTCDSKEAKPTYSVGQVARYVLKLRRSSSLLPYPVTLFLPRATVRNGYLLAICVGIAICRSTLEIHHQHSEGLPGHFLGL